MTDRQVAKRVDFWRKELELLGLSHWHLQLNIENEPTNMHGGRVNASVLTEDCYDVAKIVIADDIIPDGPEASEQLDYCIVHELIHVLMRDFDAAIMSITEHLAAPAASQWEARIEHEEEGVVDRLARAVVRLYHKHHG